MTSAINAANPAAINPTTQSVRDNFAAARWNKGVCCVNCKQYCV